MVEVTLDIPNDIYTGNVLISKLFGISFEEMMIKMMKMNMLAAKQTIDEKADEIHGKSSC